MAIDFLNEFGVGSKLDTVAMVEAMVKADIAPKQTSIDRRATDLELKISGTAQLKSAMQTLFDLASTYDDAREFSALSISQSDDSSVSAKFTDGSALPGVHNLEIDQLAQNSLFVSNEFANYDQDLNNGNPGSFSFKLSSGQLQTITLNANEVTLENLTNAINDLDGGVNAKIIETSSGVYRLFMESDESGYENEIIISSDLFGIGTNQTKVGQDAVIQYNGIEITRSTNNVQDLIEGVQLDLESISTGLFSITIQQDTVQQKEKIKTLVAGFNAFFSKVNELKAVEANGNAQGELYGDSLVKEIHSAIKDVLLAESSVSGDDVKRLSDIGIAIDRFGVFQIDENILSESLSNNYEGIQSLFTADTNGESLYGSNDSGLAGNVRKRLNDYLKYKGVMFEREISNSNVANDLIEETDTLKFLEEGLTDRYTKKFSAMNRIISEMNTLKEYLDGQLSNLPYTSKK